MRVRWYTLISESPALPLRLVGSGLTGDKVRAGVGVEDRVEDLEEGCTELDESVSFARRILVGSVVSRSWILSSRDSPALGGVSKLSVAIVEGMRDGFPELTTAELALEVGVSGDDVLESIRVLRLLDLLGRAGRRGASESGSPVRTRNGCTRREGEANGVASVDRASGGGAASGSSVGLFFCGDSEPVNCFNALDGVLSGDWGISESMSQLTVRRSVTCFS